jgi:hypothetical protein
MIRREYKLFADQLQFYLQDDDAHVDDLSGAWTEDSVKRMLAVARGVVGIGTARNMAIPVVVEVLEVEPAKDVDEWEHVVEGALDVMTGRVVVAGCTDYFPDADRIPVHPGAYQVRMSCRGLDTLSPNGLGGGDHYRVQLWPTSEPTEPVVLKQRLAQAYSSISDGRPGPRD